MRSLRLNHNHPIFRPELCRDIPPTTTCCVGRPNFDARRCFCAPRHCRFGSQRGSSLAKLCAIQDGVQQILRGKRLLPSLAAKRSGASAEPCGD